MILTISQTQLKLLTHMNENIETLIFKLIDESDLNLKQIATRADVSYMVLWRWHSGNTNSLNAVMAEHVYETLTGKSFIR